MSGWPFERSCAYIPLVTTAPPVDPALIGSFRLFGTLDEPEKQALAEMATVEEVPAGGLILEEGDPADCVYLVAEGRVTLCMRLPGRSETCILTLGEGELLGWSGLLQRRWVATARAAEPTTLVRFPASELLALCERDHHVGYAIMSQAFEEVADRLHQTRLQLLDMFGRPGG